MSGTLVFISSPHFLQLLPKRRPLTGWLMARGACIPGPHRTVAITETVLGRTLHTEQTEIYPHPSLSVKLASLLVLELWPEKQTSNLAHSEWPTKFSRDTGHGCHPGALPLPCSSWLVSPKKQLIHLSGATAFLPPRDTSRFPGSGSQQGLHLESHRTPYISIVLKAAA